MCFKPKRDPKIDAQLEKQRQEAEAARLKAQEEIKLQKEKALEEAKQSEAAKTTAKVTEGQEYRQSETMAGDAVSNTGEKKTTSPTSLVDVNKSAAAMRRSRRKGRSGRRSLITASTAQGYFSRFL